MTLPARGTLVRLHRKATPEDLTDEGLVAACATADRAARALLFERHVDSVHRFVARMRGSDEHAIDDLVQMTFVTAFQSAATFRGGAVRSWLFGISANLVRKYARTEIRRKTALKAMGGFAEASTNSDAAVLARLPAAIAALPLEQREALVLVDLEGEQGDAAAAILGIPAGTLWRRLYHARQAVRRSLGGEP